MTQSWQAWSGRLWQSIRKQQILGPSPHHPALDLRHLPGMPQGSDAPTRSLTLSREGGTQFWLLLSHHGIQFSESLRYPRAHPASGLLQISKGSWDEPSPSLHSSFRLETSRSQNVAYPRVQSLQAGAWYSNASPSSLLSGKPGPPGLRPLRASVKEPRVLAQSHCSSWATLTMAPFRVEPAHGAGIRVQTLRKSLAWIGGVVVAALSTEQPDMGVVTPTAGATELGLPGTRQV